MMIADDEKYCALGNYDRLYFCATFANMYAPRQQFVQTVQRNIKVTNNDLDLDFQAKRFGLER